MSSKLVSRDTKDQLSNYHARQTGMKGSDRRKTHQYRKVWKESKGWGTRSGRPDCEFRNYGISTRIHGQVVAPPEVDERPVDVDYAMDGPDQYDDYCSSPAPATRGVQVGLLDIAQPRTRATKRPNKTAQPGAGIPSDFWSDHIPDLDSLAVPEGFWDAHSPVPSSSSSTDTEDDSEDEVDPTVLDASDFDCSTVRADDDDDDDEWEDLYPETAPRPTYAQMTRFEAL